MVVYFTIFLNKVQVQCGNHQIPTATVNLYDGEKELLVSATGTGPVDACYKAIATLTADAIDSKDLKLLEYTVTSGLFLCVPLHQIFI